MRYLSVVIVLCAGFCHADDKTLGDQQVRDSIKRGLSFIREGGQEWREQRQCVSCHRISFEIWSHRAAARAGLTVDQKSVDETTAWAVDWKHWPQPTQKTNEKDSANRNTETMATLLLANAAGSSSKNAAPDWAENFRDHLIRTQQKDGSWKPKGQLPLQRRPLKETTEVSTMWVVLALNSKGLSSKKSRATVDRAVKRLETAKPGISTEWWVARLLLMRMLNRLEAAEKIQKKLLTLQNEDGGWGWLHAEKSDAFGTGLALYALAQAKSKDSQAAIAKARSFLIKTQVKNGSWDVPSSRKKDNRAVIDTSRFWGTTWAVIGLAESLQGRGGSVVKRVSQK